MVSSMKNVFRIETAQPRIESGEIALKHIFQNVKLYNSRDLKMLICLFAVNMLRLLVANAI